MKIIIAGLFALGVAVCLAGSVDTWSQHRGRSVALAVVGGESLLFFVLVVFGK